MAQTFEFYLENDYLEEDRYLSNVGQFAMAAQFEANINLETALAAQLEGALTGDVALAAQLEAKNFDGVKALASQALAKLLATGSLASQVEFQTEVMQALASEFTAKIFDVGVPMASQYLARVFLLSILPAQADARIDNNPAILPSQMEGFLSRKKILAAEFKAGTLLHLVCNSYLENDYLSEPYYLASCRLAAMPGQLRAVLSGTQSLPAQFEATLVGQKVLPTELEAKLNNIQPMAAQFAATTLQVLAAQVRVAIYNDKNFRVLYEFPSRGISGTNWTASTTATGDFDVNNVNSDTVEEIWRSTTPNSQSLVCDTEIPQGTFLDTFSVQNHNFTNSATVFLQGSDDALFTTIGFNERLTVTERNMYYIAPSLPLSGFRYWRITIDDPGNPDGYVQCGTIIFGSSLILANNNISNGIRIKTNHFKDTVQTEGFTSVSNDRALRKRVSVTFNSVDVSSGDYAAIQTLFNFIRTDLKALFLPVPDKPTRFGVFAKLADLPEEEHIDNSSDGTEDAAYADFSIDMDEAL